MKKGLCLVFVIVLASAALVACGNGDEPTATPTVASVVATATPTPTATPTATPTPTSTPMPTPTATAAPEVEGDTDPLMACLPGGMLDDAATVSSCNAQAMLQVQSFSFDGEINLLAIFGVEGTGEGLIRVSGTIVLPDRFSFTVSLNDEGQMVEMSGLVIGQDGYFQDPESNLWFKGTPPDAEFLGLVQQVGLLHLPTDIGATLTESIDLDDGTRGYVLLSEQTGQETGMEELGFPGGTLIRVVGADDFLTREVRVTVVGFDEEMRDIITIRYLGYNETHEIEPPAEYMEVPEQLMESGTPGAATVVGLTKNEEGDIVVTFSEPVFVQGDVELYVLDPDTGGWGLPLLEGSGTDTFTFDADAEDRPALIAGESQLAGFSFPAEDSQLLDDEGTSVNLNFDLWTYE